MICERLGLRVPVIQAPMAGITTPRLAAAVSAAGGLGSLGVAALDAEAADRQVAEALALAPGLPLNVNVFCHRPPRRDARREAAWLDRLAPHFERHGARPPDALTNNYRSFLLDDAMMRMLLDRRPAVISFHFGLPRPDQIEALRDTGAVLLATATAPHEARSIRAAGLDGIVAQGIEAGGHRGLFDENGPDERLPTLALLGELRQSGLPLIAAGGIMTADDVRSVLAAGAQAAQCGTAFLTAEEAATSAAHRAALAAGATRLTRAISGRPARAVENRISGIEDGEAPDYPLPYSALKALHAVASAAGDHGYGPFWAGSGCARARPGSAAEILASLDPA